MTFYEELIIEDGIVLTGTCLIPEAQRKDILQQIHRGHLGIISKKTVDWPGIYNDIEEMVSNCETCLKFTANNRKQNPDGVLGHEVPVTPWTQLAIDIFTFGNNNYLVVVDYTSKFHIVCRLPSMTARTVTEILKSIFAEYRLPTCIISDNGPSYELEYLTKGRNKLQILHITTLPHHHQNNGLAEVYVKISRAILQKAKDTNKNPHITMMVYRTTPWA